METTLLLALCSTDVSVCQLVTTCISSFYEDSMLLNSAPPAAKIVPLRNVEIWKDLASKDFRFTGLVAFQKRARGLIRNMQQPTIGILAAWEIVFDRWIRLSQEVLRSSEAMDEKSISEWRNYSGLLASLGGSCLSNQAAICNDPNVGNFRWIDRPFNDDHDESLLTRYLKQSVQLLASTNVRIREATREALSSETSRVLLIPLLETLGSELDFLFDNPTVHSIAPNGEPKAVFAEQGASLLKSIVDRLGSPVESTGSSFPVDIGSLTLNFAKFMSKAPEGAGTLRIKIKVCQLCEGVMHKKELLNLRHDVRVRNQLLEIIFDWIARPNSPKTDNVLMSNARADDVLRLQKDLDKSCLRALAHLTYRLPLQPAEGQTDADTSDLKSEMFRTYFNRFLSLLNQESNINNYPDGRQSSSAIDDAATNPELAITALSNLLSANIDVGLKHSLSIGYHEDMDIRTAFVKVLCNILVQGTEFNNLSDAAVNRKYDELLEASLTLSSQYPADE